MLSAKPWKMEGVLLLIAGILLSISGFSLGQLVLQRILGKASFDEGTLLYLVFGSLTLHGSILFGTAVCLWWQQISWGETFGFSTPYKLRAMLWGFLAALLFEPVGGILQELSMRVLQFLNVTTSTQEAVAEFDKVSTLASRIYLTAFAILLAPLAEEIFFRGILYTGLKQFSRDAMGGKRAIMIGWMIIILLLGILPGSHFPNARVFAVLLAFGLFLAWWFERMGRPGVAIWGSATFFAAIHNSPQIFLPLLLLGFILVWLYEKTNTLLASITAHSAFNALNVMLLLFGDSLSDWQHNVLRHLP